MKGVACSDISPYDVLKMKKFAFLLAALSAFSAFPAIASNIDINSAELNIIYQVDGQTYSIQRDWDAVVSNNETNGVSPRICPPFCEKQLAIHESVETVEEEELLGFLVDYVSIGTGVLIDARPEQAFQAGTIPGAINLPHNLFAVTQENVFHDSVIELLGGAKTGTGEWVFSDAQDLLLFCDGMTGIHAADAIRNLLAVNYPPEKLHFYRGGMISWTASGLTTTFP